MTTTYPAAPCPLHGATLAPLRTTGLVWAGETGAGCVKRAQDYAAAGQYAAARLLAGIVAGPAAGGNPAAGPAVPIVKEHSG